MQMTVSPILPCVTTRIRLYLHPFLELPFSTWLSVLPFGIVVEPSPVGAWLLIVLPQQEFPAIKEVLKGHDKYLPFASYINRQDVVSIFSRATRIFIFRLVKNTIAVKLFSTEESIFHSAWPFGFQLCCVKSLLLLYMSPYSSDYIIFTIVKSRASGRLPLLLSRIVVEPSLLEGLGCWLSQREFPAIHEI